MKALWVTLALFLVTGCSFIERSRSKTDAKLTGNSSALEEHSRALTTGIVDTLSNAPTNTHTDLALDFAKLDQQIEGTPVHRIDVEALINNQKAARRELAKRTGEVDRLLTEREDLRKKLSEAEAKLIEMGKLYEEEKNKSIVKRIWAWTMGTLGIGGLVALCILCPAVIPIIGQVLSFVIAKIPGIASFVGVVGKQAFDGVVKGVGNIRWRLKEQENLPADKQPVYTPAEVRKMFDDELKDATERVGGGFKTLIDSRRAALNV